MHSKHKIIAVAAVVCMTAAALFGSTRQMTGASDHLTGLSLFGHKETLYFWYSDDSMTDFISSAAVSFGEKTGTRVIPQLTSDSEYLEAINRESLEARQIPDVYMISNDSLEKAYLAGLASEVDDVEGICNPQHFPQAALSAVTYHDKLVAYPFFYETSALVYNETYLEEWAGQQALKELSGAEAGEGAAEGTGEVDETVLAEKTAQYLAQAIPATVDDILNIGDTFDVPEGVEGIMKWDVSDIFYNYWIVGNSMIVGGDPGDDEHNININNPATIQSLEVYKNLNQFFYIESDTVTYDSVVEDFMNGKIVFTIATTDVLRKLEQARQDGSFAYDYGIGLVPDVSAELPSRSLSVTSAIAVNGYSQKKELANEFAAYLTNDCAANLYERTGRMSSSLSANPDNGAVQIFMEEYASSIPLPKMIETSNLWIQLEILFSKVWNGEDASALLTQLSDQILMQTGTVPLGEE